MNTKRHLILILILLLIISLVVGCGKPKEQVPAGGENNQNETNARSAQSGKRDTVNLSTTKTLTSVDPHNNRAAVDVAVHGQMFEPLYHLDEKTGNLEPRIAESYEVSEDGLVWTFKIRDGVKFHNGETLKASDVVFSYERAMEAPVLKSFVSSIKEVDAPDDNTFVATLHQPMAAFLSTSCNIFIVNEKEVIEQGEEFGTKLTLAGTGPYYLTSLEMDTKWTFKAFPDYYRGEAEIKEINYVPITDASTGLIAFENGELDWYVAPIANWNSLVESDKYNYELVPANHISYVFINWMRKPLDNDNVRKAIAHAIDKEAMNIVAFDGLAQETDFMENPDYVFGAPEETVNYPYDPEKSKKLLKDAGFTDVVDVGTITVSSGSYYQKMAEVLKDSLEEVGIKVEINMMESGAAMDNFRKQNYDIGISGGSGQADYSAFRQRVHSSAAGSYWVKLEGDKFDYKKIDSLFEEGEAEMDPDKRIEIYRELNNRIMETTCWLPVFNKVQTYVWNKELNVVNHPVNYYVYEWSWK